MLYQIDMKMCDEKCILWIIPPTSMTRYTNYINISNNKFVKSLDEEIDLAVHREKVL